MLVEGELVATNFDIYSNASGINKPFVVTFSTIVRDGAVTVEFIRNKSNPQINGIVVSDNTTLIAAPVNMPVKAPIKVPVKAPLKVPIKAPVKVPVHTPIKPPTTAPVPGTDGNIVHRIDCGSTSQVVVLPNNVVWTPDQYSSSGLSYNTCGNNTASIYCTSRFFRVVDPASFQYDLPVSANNRAYTVRLYFAEQVRNLFVVV